MAAIFGPSSPSTYGIVASIAARFDVPHIDYFWRQNEELHADQEPKNPKPMTINFFPDSEMVGKVSQLLQKFLKNLEKQISPCLRAIYKLWIDIRQLIFENVDNSIPDRSKFPRYSKLSIPEYRVRGKEYTIFCISLETKVPQDGATQPIGVNYPITRKYSYFLLGLKTGRGVKLIRINPVSLYVAFSSFFFFFFTCSNTFTGR